jgi:transposase-like protein
VNGKQIPSGKRDVQRFGILPSQLFRWRRDFLRDSEHGQIAAREEQQRPAADAHCVVEILIGNAPARTPGPFLKLRY